MFVSPEKILAAHMNNVETMFSAANALFSGAERLAVLNLETARNVLEDGMGATRSLADLKDPATLLKAPADIAQPLLEKSLAYGRSVYEIQLQTMEELAALGDAQRAAVTKALYGAIDALGKNAPAGSEVAISAVKSALAASNSAYDGMVKAVRQAADVAEANVAAATSATVKATRPAAISGKSRKAA